MKIVHIVPGSGDTFYCQNCLRDGSLIASLRARGHDIIVVPMYLPLFTDRPDVTGDSPVFYGAVSIYLKEKFPLLRRMPRKIKSFLDSPGVLEYAARKARSTRARGLERMTISVLQGEDGRQAAELEHLVQWLSAETKPDIVHLSNALLAGLARRIKQELHVPVVCSLQDEDSWVDAMEPDDRKRVWEIMARKAADVEAFAAVSGAYAVRMAEKLAIPEQRLHVVHIGIRPDEYPPARMDFSPPTVGFLSRLSPSLGLDTLARAFMLLKKEPRLKDLRLAAMGGTLGDDVRYLRHLTEVFRTNGHLQDVALLPEFGRAHRLEFLRSLSVLSVPVPQGEAFGMYLLEAMACGVPVVQPRVGAFPEIVEKTGAGLLYEPNDPETLALTLETLLLDPPRARALGAKGPDGVARHFNIATMTDKMLDIYRKTISATGPKT
jgi:glycosyltransferase involved in cell wall biosynthesis